MSAAMIILIKNTQKCVWCKPDKKRNKNDCQKNDD